MSVPPTRMTALDWAMVGVLTLVVAVGTCVGVLVAGWVQGAFFLWTLP